MTLEDVKTWWEKQRPIMQKGNHAVDILCIDWLISHVKELESALADTINGQGKRILKLEEDLKLNASMLAKQCDLAREAEIKTIELQSGIRKFQYNFLTKEELFELLEE